MMKKCVYCQEDIPAEAKVCKLCNSAVVKKCQFCAEEINVMAKRCKFCNTDLAPSSGNAAGASHAQHLSKGPLGEERNIGTLLLLTLVTCGIYGIVHLFQIAGEINRHIGQEKLTPGIDLLLCIVTCGIWGLVVCYRYPKAIYEMSVVEGIPAQDQSGMCIIVTLLGGSIVASLIMQSELNKHWKAHQGVV